MRECNRDAEEIAAGGPIMPCILDLAEFVAIVNAIETFEDLAADDDTGMLGVALLMAARSRLVKEMLAKVEACDDANKDTPIKLKDCPAYKIMKERIAARMVKRIQDNSPIFEVDDPGGFYGNDPDDLFI